MSSPALKYPENSAFMCASFFLISFHTCKDLPGKLPLLSPFNVFFKILFAIKVTDEQMECGDYCQSCCHHDFLMSSRSVC